MLMNDIIDYNVYAATAARVALDQETPRELRDSALRNLGTVATSAHQLEGVAGLGQNIDAFDAETSADVAFLADMRREYLRFEGEVDLALGEDGAQIGSGGYSQVYHLAFGDGEFAVKQTSPLTAFSLVRAFRRAQYLDGVPHLHGINIEQGRLVMDLMPGKPVGEISYDQIINIPAAHILKFIENVESLSAAGLIVEPTPQNVLYDENEGFSLVDCLAVNVTLSREDDSPLSDGAVEEVMYLLHTLQYCAPSDGATADEVKRTFPTQEQRVALMGNILDVLEEHRPDLLQRAARHERASEQTYGIAFDLIYHLDTLPAGKFQGFRDRVEQIRQRAS